MLGRQQRSGSLTLTSSDETVHLAIVRGSVRSVSTNDPALRIGQVLIQLELITEEQIEQALALQSIATDPERIGEVLVDVGYITEADVGTAMATQIASTLGIMLNDRNPSVSFTPWNRPPDGLIQPAIEDDPLILTVLFLAEHWFETASGQNARRSGPTGLTDISDIDLDPDEHPIYQRLNRIHEAVSEHAPPGRQDEAWRVARSLATALDHLREHRASKNDEAQSDRTPRPRPVYRVRLVDRTTDVWTLTDLTRAARQMLLCLLNGEQRLDALLSELRPFTTQPDRAVRELSSAGLVEIVPDDDREDEDPPGNGPGQDRTVVLRFLP